MALPGLGVDDRRSFLRQPWRLPPGSHRQAQGTRRQEPLDAPATSVTPATDGVRSASGAPLPRRRGWPGGTLASSTLSRRALILFLNAVSSVRSWIAGLLATMAQDRARPG